MSLLFFLMIFDIVFHKLVDELVLLEGLDAPDPLMPEIFNQSIDRNIFLAVVPTNCVSQDSKGSRSSDSSTAVDHQRLFLRNYFHVDLKKSVENIDSVASWSFQVSPPGPVIVVHSFGSF